MCSKKARFVSGWTTASIEVPGELKARITQRERRHHYEVPKRNVII